jgi:hypothetical protein
MRSFLIALTREPLGLAGAVLTTASAILFLILYGIDLVGLHAAGPYQGIISFLILPAIFVLGLLLMPIGMWRERRRERRAADRGEAAPAFPVFDLNRATARKSALIFVALTAVNVIILAIGTYKGVEVMDSTAFCGAACHTVMHPEYTAYRRSPHARVECVDCHIGPGADWFVKSKLSGSWQVIAVTFDLYPRPIPVPVHSLRPARETCEQCHWPQKFVGDIFKVNTHFEEDEANTRVETVLVVRVGGREADQSHGIHWHVDPRFEVRYRSDEKRQTIYEVEMLEDGVLKKHWKRSPSDSGEEETAAAWRTMDCVDCHNRPTHIFRTPVDELDDALAKKQIDPTLPYIRREGLKALQTKYPSQEEARAGIAASIEKFYSASYPDVARKRGDAVTAAAGVLGNIWCWNVFPQMNITWGTYPTDIGHPDMSTEVGCFRCHGGEQVTDDGDMIPIDCTICHTLLAEREKNPQILQTISY